MSIQKEIEYSKNFITECLIKIKDKKSSFEEKEAYTRLMNITVKNLSVLIGAEPMTLIIPYNDFIK